MNDSLLGGMQTAVGLIRAVHDKDKDSIVMLIEEALDADENVGLAAVLVCTFLIDVISLQTGLPADTVIEQLGLYVSNLTLND